MATNADGILQQDLNEMLMGHQGSVVPLIDRIQGVTTFDVQAMSGDVSVKPSAATLADAPRDGEPIGIPEGAEIDEFDLKYDDISYKILRYSGYGTIGRGQAIALSPSGVDAVNDAQEQAMRVSVIKQDRLLYSRLASTTLNETQAVTTGLWSLSTSTPIKDMLAALDKIGGMADTLVIGHRNIRPLITNPDFIARTSNFEAGAVSVPEIAAQLAGVLGIRQVVLANQLYNSAVPGAPVGLEWTFADLVWLGFASDIVRVVQEDANTVSRDPKLLREGVTPIGGGYTTGKDYSLRRAAHEVVVERRLDILRAHKDMGVNITGTIA